MQSTIASSRLAARPCLAHRRPAAPGSSSTRLRAVKRNSQLLPPPEDKAVQCLVETGIRGSLAMLAASALQLDVFSHIHWRLDDVVTGLQFATPCVAVDVALLLLYVVLSGAAGSSAADNTTTTATSAASSSSSSIPQQQQQQSDTARAGSALLAAMDAVYLHVIRYSLIGATAPSTRLALEAGSQASEELLARGALLGCASAWLAQRFLEGSLCGSQPLLPLGPLSAIAAEHSATAATTAQTLLPPCGTGPQWLAAAGLCAIMASRFVVHSNGKAAATRSQREAAAAEAAARRAVLRYEPLAVQQAAAAAAGGNMGVSELDAEAAAALAAAEAEAVEGLAQGWVGARFVLGQACLFGAFIATDNLLASFVAGLVIKLVCDVCSEKYMQRVTEASA